jgi:hypothetical protein
MCSGKNSIFSVMKKILGILSVSCSMMMYGCIAPTPSNETTPVATPVGTPRSYVLIPSSCPEVIELIHYNVRRTPVKKVVELPTV